MDFLSPLAPGDRVGDYRIVTKIGEGGMGVVYEAEQATNGRSVAIKVLSEWLVSELGRQRFEREVETCARLNHPNIIRIYDHGETAEGTLYYAMELLDGFDLGQLVERDGPQPAARVLRILDQIASALGEAHREGLIHRDIKPPNIILCEAGGEPDVAKLLDFGLVMPVRAVRRLTLDGDVIGTPRYVAPEMLEPDAELTAATDFYSLGLVAHFLASGRHAIDAADSAEILRKQKDVEPALLCEIDPAIPEDLTRVVERCLRKDPHARYPDARSLRDALRACGDARRWDREAARRWWAAARGPL